MRSFREGLALLNGVIKAGLNIGPFYSRHVFINSLYNFFVKTLHHIYAYEKERDSMRKLAYYFTLTIFSYQLLVSIFMLMPFY